MRKGLVFILLLIGLTFCVIQQPTLHAKDYVTIRLADENGVTISEGSTITLTETRTDFKIYLTNNYDHPVNVNITLSSSGLVDISPNSWTNVYLYSTGVEYLKAFSMTFTSRGVGWLEVRWHDEHGFGGVPMWTLDTMAITQNTVANPEGVLVIILVLILVPILIAVLELRRRRRMTEEPTMLDTKEPQNICPYCGRKVTPEMRRCEECGAKL